MALSCSLSPLPLGLLLVDSAAPLLCSLSRSAHFMRSSSQFLILSFDGTFMVVVLGFCGCMPGVGVMVVQVPCARSLEEDNRSLIVYR
ncbi:hypothetical protein Dimus_038064 [Dionaea muscipula]